MTVEELIEDIVHRVGTELLRQNGPKFILRAINRNYYNINRELMPLLRNVTLNSFTDTVNYITRPSDFIQFAALYPEYDFVSLQEFLSANTSQKVYTLKGDKIYFRSVDSTTSIEAWYYSRGYELVDSTAPANEQVNEPEWPEKDLHQILIYATALDLSPDYPMRARDEAMFFKLKARLAELKEYNHTTPKIIGGAVRIFQTKDPYGLV